MDVESLLSWYRNNHRCLPWRTDRTPYGTWISEAMLQQTRVTTVLDYYPRFLEHFPDIRSLAASSEDEVLKLWEGLGYYSRARNLMRGARYVCEHFDGELPESSDLLIRIPGIGPYMAGAIASQAFQEPVPAVDGNCIRIYCRLYALPMIPSERTTYNEVYSRVAKDIPPEEPGDFNEALMDFGSLICTPKSPRCTACPFATECSANLLGKQEDFPLKKTKKETPVEEHTILRIFVGKKILVHKRPSSGLLAGLFELVDLPGNMEYHEVKKWLKDNLLEFCGDSSLAASFIEPDIRVLGTGKHIFSHLRWNMIGYEIHLPDQEPIKGNAKKFGELVSAKKYGSLAFASAIRMYR
ncbi:MAG: A/G-specific adenine glycosylase [Clostridiales bacterium]|nr:A/G-specific adenine glycosylase [Clostridiales bacterium]